jgi:hypothetical protein
LHRIPERMIQFQRVANSPEIKYRNRRAFQIEDEDSRVTVTVEGGHIAEILHKATGTNPLWSPPWSSIEPSRYDPAKYPEYGANAESKLLAGILGHSLCLDLFGPPSPEEEAAGITTHGEASIVPYDITVHGRDMICQAYMPIAQLSIHRHIHLAPGGTLHIIETVENMSALDRASAWTQHVTLGPPFLKNGVTQFCAPVKRSCTLEEREFEWPYLHCLDAHTEDLRVFTNAEPYGQVTTHLVDPSRTQGFFLAFSPESQILFGYTWERSDFPWLAIWDENCSRTAPPWNGRTVTRGLEFGASPLPETRRQMILRQSLFETPAYRWLPAKTKVQVKYLAFIRSSPHMPNAP